MNPHENWFDLRAQILWTYDGPVTQFHHCIYSSSPIAAWFIRKGSVTLTFAQEKSRYTAGSWVFPKAEEGMQAFSNDAEILSIRFLAEWPTGQSLFDRSRTIAIPKREGSELLRIGTRLSRLVQRKFPGVKFELRRMSGSPSWYFELHRLFNGWMKAYTDIMEKRGLAPRTMAQIDDRVREIVHFMEMQPLNQAIRERELADRTGISISQINRLFVRDIGKTPAEYWEEKRIASARKALIESKQSIKSVAYDLGFNSLPHFSGWVKKKFGVSPKKLRASSLSRSLIQQAPKTRRTTK